MTTIREKFDLRQAKGDWGVEIEVEGTNLPHAFPGGEWLVERDGSLKANEAFEYVMPRPLDLNGVKKSLDALEKAYNQNHSVVDESIRAGVHVHMNVQEYDVTQVFTFAALYFVVEDLLLRWCGPNRNGNLFCLGSSHAEHQLFAIQEALETRNWRALKTDNLRYASLNFQSLFKYGSLEFRSMRSTRELKLIEEWIGILSELRHSAARFNNPVDIMTMFSGDGEEAFLRRILPNNWHKLTYPGYGQDIRAACRRVQPLAYTINWDGFGKPSNNPFIQQGM